MWADREAEARSATSLNLTEMTLYKVRRPYVVYLLAEVCVGGGGVNRQGRGHPPLLVQVEGNQNHCVRS